MSLRITFQPWGETLAEMADAGRRAEEAGAEVLWTSELHRSATVSAAALAAATSRARIGTSIALAFARSPMITALEALDLDELSGGRFVLGLGSGVQRLNEDWHNVRFGKPVPHLREAVRNIRLFWATCATGEEMRVDGEYEPMRIRGYQRPFAVPAAAIPVYLAAMGPLMTRLAGEIADGWISHELCSPGYLAERVLPDLEAGIARTPGKTRADLDVVVVRVLLDRRRRGRGAPPRQPGWSASTRRCAPTPTSSPSTASAADQQAVIDAFRARAASPTTSPTASATPMVDALTMTGTRDDVAARVTAYDGLADSVKLSPPTHGLARRGDAGGTGRRSSALIGELTGASA